MKVLLIVAAMAVIAILGFVVMKHVDIFLNKNRKNIDEKHIW